MEKEQRESRSGEKFTEELANLGIELNEHQKEQFDQYYELLVEWNKVMNLTGITEYEEVKLKAFYRQSFNRESEGYASGSVGDRYRNRSRISGNTT